MKILSWLLLISLIISIPFKISCAATETTAQPQLPFQLMQLQGSTLAMKQYIPATDVKYETKANTSPIVSGGRLANYLYLLSDNTYPQQIIATYRAYFEQQGLKLASDSWEKPGLGICGRFSFCGSFHGPAGGILVFPSIYAASHAELIMSNTTPQGGVTVAIISCTLKNDQKFSVPKDQAKSALIASKDMHKGENILLLSVSWSHTETQNLVAADSTLNKTPASNSQLETAAAISKELHEHGKINIYGLYFDFNKSDLKPESKPTLDAIAQTLKNDPAMNVLIVGHTDNVGTTEYNDRLSRDRADTVTNALVKTYHIPSNRLTAAGKGLREPIASNDNEAGRAKNRRVEFKVIQ